MISRWHRQSRILDIPDDHPWWVSHAQMPTVVRVTESLWRVFLAARDDRNRSNLVMVEVDPSRNMEVLGISRDRVLHHGGAGAFDRDGVGVTCAVNADGHGLWVGGGMNLRDHDRYQITSVWMTSPDGGATFDRVEAPPILEPGPANPHGAGIAQVLRIADRWHMWFTSMRAWRDTPDGQAEPTYDIRHATSPDLREWKQDDQPTISLRTPQEAGIVRPWVMPDADGFEMWYSVRGPFDPDNPASRAYRLGYATSPDARVWTRRDDQMRFDNPPVQGDWDYDMQCYPTLIEDKGQRYLFYCGNDFGRFGFGYATEVRAT